MSTNVDTPYVAPRLRTVRLRDALAVGTAAVAGAFTVGYVLAPTADDPVRAALPEPRAAAGHQFGTALTESLGLKSAPAVRGKPVDIRYRRVE